MIARSKQAQRDGNRHGFTLVEILVALVVLSLLMALLLQLSSATFAITRNCRQAIEAQENCRQVLDAIGADFSALLTQNGAPMLVGSSSSTPSDVLLSFLTQSRGPSSNSRCLAVYYQLDSSGEYQRFYGPIPWTQFNTLLAVESAFPPSSAPVVVANGIVRIDVAFELSDGTTVPLGPSQAGATWKTSTVNGQAVPSGYAALNFTNTNYPRVRAIVVSVAALDQQSYALLSASNTLSLVRSKLISPSAGQSPVQVWEPAINLAISGGAWSSVPRPVLAALQVAESTYPLPQ